LQGGRLDKSQKSRMNFLYVASWLARRLEKYNEAEEYACQGLAIDPEDPRFYHSLCLILYCRARITDDKSYLPKRIEYCDRAIEFYEKIEDGRVEIKKSINVLLNSKIYILCQMYDLLDRDNPNLLSEARKLLEQLRYREEFFNYMPEFLHTEAYYLFLSNIVNSNPSELEKANLLLQQALGINGQLNTKTILYYNELRKRIEKVIKDAY
jgi:tetratricopeptide (TPR) repeat protein